jgi:hypothetical protein
LGIPRFGDATGEPQECDWSMRVPMILLALLCLAIGVAPVLVVPLLDAVAASAADAGTLPSLGASIPFSRIATASGTILVGAGTLYAALRLAARGTRRVGTWDCGYLHPSPRLQYTGSSFARTLVGLTRALVRTRERSPVIREPHPAPAAYRGWVSDAVLDRWLLPASRWCAEQSARVRHRQSARIQVYIAYVVAVTLSLLLLMVPLTEILRRIVGK